jgi:cytochrome c553
MALACACVASMGLVGAAMPTQAAPKPAAPKTTAKPVPAAVHGGDVATGRVRSESERCQECHGADGNGIGQDGKFAKLAGQYPAYIVKQLEDFRSGARKHDLMGIMARSLDEPDLADIAAYYAGLERMHGADGSGGTDAGGTARLFAEGDAGRGIAACAACHGARGEGNREAGFPVIGGQEVKYLQNQLLAWRSGERKNSAAGVMNGVAKGLTDAEIDALAHYVAGM